MPVELSIIIVNWNGGELLRSCFRSIAQAPPSITYDIVVVDNASSDDSVAWLRSTEVAALLPGVTIDIIENADNVGFSKANNQAFTHSQSPLLLLLNPDTEVTAGAIDILIASVNSSELIGASGPQLLNTDGSLQHSVWPNPPTVPEIILTGLGLWRLFPRRMRAEMFLGGHWDHSDRRTVPMLFGAAILAKRIMIDEVGPLDERFHMYGEDYEWCLRIIRAGWQLMFEPSAKVMHHGGQFSLQRWSTIEKLQVQMNAGFQFNRYCLSRSQNIANLLATLVVSFLQKSWYKLRGRSAVEAQIVWSMNLDELKRTLSRRQPEAGEL